MSDTDRVFVSMSHPHKSGLIIIDNRRHETVFALWRDTCVYICANDSVVQMQNKQ